MKKIVSLFLALVLVLSLMPLTTFAQPVVAPHTPHPICGVSTCTDATHTLSDAWVSINSATDLAEMESGKNYYLATDITVNSTISISGTINLCLNGKTISAAGGYFDVAGTGTLNLCSCVAGGSIKRTTTTNALISADNGATANLYNVTLDGGAVWGGAKDSVLERGTTNSGITSSAPLIDAGYQYTAGGHITLNSGVILQNNECSDGGDGGAITLGEDGTLVINGATICNNAKKASNAGAIKAYAGAQITLNSGEIYGNSAYTHGGAFQIFGGHSTDEAVVVFTMNGGTIRNNKANGVGGGIAVSDYSQFIMNGGTIKDNATTDYSKRGGGVGFGDANTTMTISGNAVISGNVAGINANNLYIGNNDCNKLSVETMGSNANVGVTMSSPGVFSSGGASYTSKFKSDNAEYEVTDDGDNLKLVASSTTTYIVTYKTADGSSTLGSVKVAAGAYALPACTFTPPAGKQFKGWATEANGEAIATATISVSGDTTLYAIWEGVPHVHSYTYSATDNVITESCTCGHSETATLEIDTTVSTIYNGSAIKALKVAYSSGWMGDKNVEISYSNNINAGTANGSVTIGDKTATKSFDITKKVANAPEAPTDLTATVGQKLSDVTLPNGWRWKEPNTIVGSEGASTFLAVFTPSDSNYTPVEISVTVSVSAPAPTTYIVSFNANGGSGTMDPVMAEASVEFTYPACTFTAPAGKQFKGWSTDAERIEVIPVGTKHNLNGGDHLSLYAIWETIEDSTQQPTDKYTISGTVVEKATGEPVTGATVELKLGNKKIAPTTTKENGSYSFADQPIGTYNVVASKNGKIVTVLVELRDNKVCDIELPASITNSIVEHVTPEGFTAGTLVGGLDKVAQDLREQPSNATATDIVIKLKVEEQKTESIGETVREQHKAIQREAPDKELLFFDLSVWKTVGTEQPEYMSELRSLLEIYIPFDGSDKENVMVYRYHGNAAEVLPSVNKDSDSEGYWVGDDGYIHILAYRFSTYAIGYTEKSDSQPSYNYPIYVAPVEDEAEQIASPQTFDAGITLPVVVTILGATGSAWLLRKKDD